MGSGMNVSLCFEMGGGTFIQSTHTGYNLHKILHVLTGCGWRLWCLLKVIGLEFWKGVGINGEFILVKMSKML